MANTNLRGGSNVKLLFLTRSENFPAYKQDGGALVTLRNFEMIKQICGNDNVIVDVIYNKESGESTEVNYYKAYTNIVSRYISYMCLRVFPKKTEKQIIKHIIELNPDIIFFDGSIYGQIIKNKFIRKKKTVIFFHNVEQQYTWDQVKNYSLLCLPRYFAARHCEKKMIIYGRKLICLNNRDRELISQYYGKDTDLMLPVTFRDTYHNNNISEQKSQGGEFVLLYIGSYFVHNYKGLLWFLNNVMPFVNAKLVVVGKNMEKIREKVGVSENIVVAGTVEELGKYYTAADAMVMPIFMGGGMKVKTAEALMYGKTIFASKEALEGYEVAHVSNITECNSAEEFISGISKCIASGVNQKFNSNVRQVFLENYCTEKYIPKLGQLINECLLGGDNN